MHHSLAWPPEFFGSYKIATTPLWEERMREKEEKILQIEDRGWR
jgi:hypothetical protein